MSVGTIGPITWLACAMPLLSNIVFDNTGSMIVAVMDVGGHLWGSRNYPPDANDRFYSGTSAGDTLHACFDPTAKTWAIEQTAGCMVGTVRDPANFNYAEFFWRENGPGDRLQHPETGMGSAIFNPNTNNVIIPSLDPLVLHSGGINWLYATAGDRKNTIQLYEGTTVDTPGKSSGLGEPDMICPLIPVEIGHRVWEDINGNGMQDSYESGIPNVVVKLIDVDGGVEASIDLMSPSTCSRGTTTGWKSKRARLRSTLFL